MPCESQSAIKCDIEILRKHVMFQDDLLIEAPSMIVVRNELIQWKKTNNNIKRLNLYL